MYSEHPDHREKFGVDQWTSPDQEVHRRSHTVLNTSGLNPRAVPWKPLPSNKPLRTSHVTNGEENKGKQYLDTVKKLAVAALLPKSELPPFDGNPLKYFTFIRSFENNVEKDTDDFSHRLQLLVQFCTGRLAQLDNEDRLVKIMERCPVFVRARWQTCSINPFGRKRSKC